CPQLVPEFPVARCGRTRSRQPIDLCCKRASYLPRVNVFDSLESHSPSQRKPDAATLSWHGRTNVAESAIDSGAEHRKNCKPRSERPVPSRTASVLPNCKCPS